MECYSPTLNKWTNVAPMPTARWVSAAAQGPNGRLFVMGGLGAGGTALATVESYNPNLDAWSTVVSMPTARFGLAAAAGFDGRIYAYGGANTAGTALAVNQVLSAFGGFAAAPATKSLSDATTDLDSSMLTSATPSVAPLSGTTNQWMVPSSGASDNTTLRAGTDAVFTLGVDGLSTDLTDAVFAGGIG